MQISLGYVILKTVTK